MSVAAAPDDAAMAGLPPAAAAAFAALRAQFLAGLPRRWAEIASAADDAQRRAALHRLAGAAGGYGCPRLGESARRAERAAGEELVAALAELQQLLTAPPATVR
jgi:HPt (histidine-containing phosphotransfer) domain-containing protein